MSQIRKSNGTLEFLQHIKNKAELPTIEEIIYQEDTQITKIHPKKICNWKHHDRNQFEYGDLDALANDIKNNGQQQPIIVRPIKHKKYNFEVIAGERRWRAASAIDIDLLAIVKPFSDEEAAICQIAENNHREKISDYSRGMNIYNLMKKNIITQNELKDKIGLSQSSISGLLSFSQVPKEIWEAVQDLSNVSSRTASEIRVLCNKGQEYIDALKGISDIIREGKGRRTIESEVNKIINNKNVRKKAAHKNKKVLNKNGEHVFTWTLKNSVAIGLKFTSSIKGEKRKTIEKKIMQILDS
jgi:ParB family chromosome partitioning protein